MDDHPHKKLNLDSWCLFMGDKMSGTVHTHGVTLRFLFRVCWKFPASHLAVFTGDRQWNTRQSSPWSLTSTNIQEQTMHGAYLLAHHWSAPLQSLLLLFTLRILKRPLEDNLKEVKDHQNAEIATKCISFASFNCCRWSHPICHCSVRWLGKSLFREYCM